MPRRRKRWALLSVQPSGDVCPQTGWEKVPDSSLNMLLKPVAISQSLAFLLTAGS